MVTLVEDEANTFFKLPATHLASIRLEKIDNSSVLDARHVFFNIFNNVNFLGLCNRFYIRFLRANRDAFHR